MFLRSGPRRAGSRVGALRARRLPLRLAGSGVVSLLAGRLFWRRRSRGAAPSRSALRGRRVRGRRRRPCPWPRRRRRWSAAFVRASRAAPCSAAEAAEARRTTAAQYLPPTQAPPTSIAPTNSSLEEPAAAARAPAPRRLLALGHGEHQLQAARPRLSRCPSAAARAATARWRARWREAARPPPPPSTTASDVASSPISSSLRVEQHDVPFQLAGARAPVRRRAGARAPC